MYMDNKIMKIYISGPISGQDQAECRILFNEIAKQIEEAGHEPINPFHLHDGRELVQTWEQNLKEDLAELIWCDAIYLLPGWKSSKGARLEAHVAAELHLKVLYHNNQPNKNQLSFDL